MTTTQPEPQNHFVAICPDCGDDWPMILDTIAMVGIRNTYGADVVNARFRRLAANPPEMRCSLCIFRGGGWG